MRMIDLFSGIGGFAYAASKVWKDDLEIINFVESDKFCQKVLKKNFPGVPIESDIKKYTARKRGTIDLITGGFPCQPFSIAGKRKGKEDDRNLWPEMFRIIQEAKPTWIIGENVANYSNFVEFENSLIDLENEGYEVQSFIIPALSVGAPHRRDRIWIIAYSTISRSQISSQQTMDRATRDFNESSWDKSWVEVAAEFCRVDDGIPNRVDRLKGLGNSIVPQVVMQIMKAIKEIKA